MPAKRSRDDERPPTPEEIQRARAELDRISTMLEREFERLSVPVVERGRILHMWGLGLLVAGGMDDDEIDECTDAALARIDAEVEAHRAERARKGRSG